jgi:hypothetical protein
VILTPTTFVVGAGASVAYGFPTATELRRRATLIGPQAEAYQLLNQSGAQIGHLNTFLTDLRQHPAPSIDAFLESRQSKPDTMQIGRLVIAILMAEAAFNARGLPPANPADDWLAYVIEQMRAGAPTWQDFVAGNAGVRFVTFNFDSVIENALARAIRSIYQYDVTDDDVKTAMATFPVLHVHGRLPELPDSPLKPDPLSGFSSDWRLWLPAAASQLHVVLDATDAAIVAAARVAVDQATVLCFLGFAYARENLDRIMPEQFSMPLPDIYGSAFGLRAGQRDWVRGRIANIKLAGQESNCLDVLKDCYVFRD